MLVFQSYPCFPAVVIYVSVRASDLTVCLFFCLQSFAVQHSGEGSKADGQQHVRLFGFPLLPVLRPSSGRLGHKERAGGRKADSCFSLLATYSADVLSSSCIYLGWGLPAGVSGCSVPTHLECQDVVFLPTWSVRM